MTISERLFMIMEEKGITMPELSRMTGISRHTIFDWKRRKTNPGADKIMIICEALQITPEELLAGKKKEEMKQAKLKEETKERDDNIELEIKEPSKRIKKKKKQSR